MKTLLLLAAGVSGPWCHYTVRDIGYVDLLGPEYRLVCGGDRDTTVTAAAREAIEEELAFSNLVLESGGPSGWRLHREGLAPLALPVEGRDEAAALQAFEQAARSPVQEFLRTKALDSFALLVRVHGTETEEEARVDQVLEEVRGSLGTLSLTLPRPIDRPLVEREIPVEERAAERVLLWSLGYAPKETRPAVVLLYGRGKLAGDVLFGDAITEAELTAQLTLVGEDCECETPRDWVGTPRIPMRWTDSERRGAGHALGFDPESPMVRGEVARILGRTAPRDEGIHGYREVGPEGDRPIAAAGGSESGRGGGQAVTTFQATEGDDWGFEEESVARERSEPTGAEESPAQLASRIETFGLRFLVFAGSGMLLSVLIAFLVLGRRNG